MGKVAGIGVGGGAAGEEVLRQLGRGVWAAGKRVLGQLRRGCWGSWGFMWSQDLSVWSLHVSWCGRPHSMAALRQNAYMAVQGSSTNVPEKVPEVVSPRRPGLQSHVAAPPWALWATRSLKSWEIQVEETWSHPSLSAGEGETVGGLLSNCDCLILLTTPVSEGLLLPASHSSS